MKPDADRRKLLKMLPALAATPPAGFAAAPAMADDRRLAAMLLDVFSRPHSARMVGLAYLRERPQEAAFSTIMAHLKDDLDLAGWCRAGAGPSDLRRRLRARAAIEFESHDFIEIGGCCLSVSELRLCALSTLS
jgi:hypothetical protein